MDIALDHQFRRSVAMRAAIRFAAGIALLALVVVGPSGTFAYWQGWLFVAVVATCSLTVMIWLALRDPDLLDRRLRMKEKEREQKRLIAPGWVFALAAFAFPAVDHRFGWSSVPPAVAIAADGVVIGAYAIFVAVLRENRWASRVIEVEARQKVVTTGPYAIVRHPMYAAAALIYLFAPVALGSFWGMLMTVPLAAILFPRIRNEESVLRRDLPGYDEYATRVRYRLVPRMW